MRDGQRLDDVGVAVFVGDEAQDAFVHGAAHHEAEARVETVAHVGEVLVRHEFEQHGRNAWYPSLEVTLVPHAAARPFRVGLQAQVVGNLCLHDVAEVAVEVA